MLNLAALEPPVAVAATEAVAFSGSGATLTTALPFAAAALNVEAVVGDPEKGYQKKVAEASLLGRGGIKEKALGTSI